MFIEPVEDVLDAEVEAHLLPLVAAAQVQQAVAGGFHFVAFRGNFGLRGDQVHFGCAGPFAQLLHHRQFGVQRHHIVQVVAGGFVFTPNVAQQAGCRKVAVGGFLGQRVMAGNIQAINAGGLIDEPEIDEPICHVQVCLSTSASRGAGTTFSIDVVVDVGVVGRHFQAPLLLRGIVPVERCAECVGNFGLQVEVAHIAVAITGPVDHAHRHAAGRPGVALVEVGGAGLPRITEFEGPCFGWHKAGQRGQVDVVVGFLAVGIIEGGCVGRVRGVIPLHLAGIHVDFFVAQAELRQPPRVPLRFPFAECRQTVALAVVDVPEHVGRHPPAGWIPPVVQAVALYFSANADQVSRRQRDIRLDDRAGIFPFGIHRHACRASGLAFGGYAGGSIGNGCPIAVPEQFVIEELHVMPRIFMIGPRFQLAPVVLPLVAQVDLLAVVAGHVHALVGPALVGNVLQAQFQFEQMIFMARGQGDRLVGRLVHAGADFVGIDDVPIIGVDIGRLEIVAGMVIVGLHRRTTVGHAHLFAGDRRRQVAATGIAVAAVEHAGLALL